ncbi:MAG: sigma 54 modulation/S30EA ribosomal C-terminal domain-containing protein [Actinomycetota bacterium]
MAYLSEMAPAAVVSTRVKVKHYENRAPDQVSIAQASMDVSGIELRVEAAGATSSSALHAVGERLEKKLAGLADRLGGSDESASPLSGGLLQSEDDSSRPAFHYPPPERRAVVRRKMYSPLDRLSVTEALFNLEALDYRFFLFTDAADDKTSIVYQDLDGPALRKIDGSRGSGAHVPENIHVNEAEAPSITVADAVSLLNSSDMPFVFFRDRDRGRASVLYRRYDGHYGLLVPSTRIV